MRLLCLALLVQSSSSAAINTGAAATNNASLAHSLPSSWPAARWLSMMHSANHPRVQGWAALMENSLKRLGKEDREGKRLASMSAESCGPNYAAGVSVNQGLLIEFGTWAGGSMRCFAAGLNRTGHKGRAIGFDAFEAGFVHGNEEKLRGTRWWDEKMTRKQRQQLDLMPIYHWNIDDVYPTVRAERVNFRISQNVDNVLGASAMVDVFITDAAKHAVQLAQDLATVAPYLNPGSITVFSDFFWEPTADDHPRSNEILFTFGMLVPKTLQFLGISANGYAYFVVLKKVSRAEILHASSLWQGGLASTRCSQSRSSSVMALQDARQGAPPQVRSLCAQMKRLVESVKCK